MLNGKKLKVLLQWNLLEKHIMKEDQLIWNSCGLLITCKALTKQIWLEKFASDLQGIYTNSIGNLLNMENLMKIRSRSYHKVVILLMIVSIPPWITSMYSAVTSQGNLLHGTSNLKIFRLSARPSPTFWLTGYMKLMKLQQPWLNHQSMQSTYSKIHSPFIQNTLIMFLVKWRIILTKQLIMWPSLKTAIRSSLRLFIQSKPPPHS